MIYAASLIIQQVDAFFFHLDAVHEICLFAHEIETFRGHLIQKLLNVFFHRFLFSPILYQIAFPLPGL